jgi:hypothetical protein
MISAYKSMKWKSSREKGWREKAKMQQFIGCISVAGQIAGTEPEPEFLQPLENHTVTQGRDIFFTCVVNHLGPYKVRVSGDGDTGV